MFSAARTGAFTGVPTSARSVAVSVTIEDDVDLLGAAITQAVPGLADRIATADAPE
jgi:hypothetical protein